MPIVLLILPAALHAIDPISSAPRSVSAAAESATAYVAPTQAYVLDWQAKKLIKKLPAIKTKVFNPYD